MRVSSAFAMAFVVVLMMLLTSIPSSSDGHAPHFPSSNNDLENPYEISDHAKSWVLYSSLAENGVGYYRVGLDTVDRLLLQILVPVSEGKRGFVPNIAIMIPGGTPGEPLPSFVNVPEGYGHEVVSGSLPSAIDYEGITATAFYTVVDFDEIVGEFADEKGAFIIAVYHPAGLHGDYALVMGYKEMFTLTEIVMVPLSLLQIYLWAGNGILAVAIPFALVAGFGTIPLLRDRSKSLARKFIRIAGFLFLATAAVVTVQMTIALSQSGWGSEALATIGLIFLSLALGALTIRFSVRDFNDALKTRALLMGLALVAVISWNGYLIGPLLLIAAATMLRFPRDASMALED